MSKWVIISIIGLTLLGVSFYSEARGVRNNNPGNIRAVPGVTWQGQINIDDKGFVVFDTLSNGFRALFITLRTYRYKYGLSTITDIISRYAPSSENDTTQYIQAVSRDVRIPPDVGIPPDRIPDLMQAIAKHETGKTFALEQIAQGIALA